MSFDCHRESQSAYGPMVWCRGGGGGGDLYGETTQEWVTFFTVQIFFPGSDNIKGQAGISHELKYIKSMKDLLKLEHFENNLMHQSYTQFI